MLSNWRDILKFTESAIGKFSGNIAYDRKLLKALVKSLKNACYSINFWKICEKQAYNVTKIWAPLRSFTNIKPRLYETFFGRSSYLVTASVYIRKVSKRWLKFLCFQEHYKKTNMLTMYNVKTEYKKIGMHSKQN